MTELETLLLRQLAQQQSESEQLVTGLSEQLDRLQTALSKQQADSQALHREMERSDYKNAVVIEQLTERVEHLSALLSSWTKKFSE
ncbi:hypothetical protein [Vreelandella massiliensis]|uniref:hypothetical protein n=1 Tax=Vreelandella massiliensis TaxID=1816686 RepID=UPI001F3F77B2|nr:hypothetical protein [Halomonas massiliensis]